MSGQDRRSRVRPPAPDTGPEAPVELRRIQPRGVIRVVFWGLRLYILVMVILVIIGFARGLH
jgi:hypothetical protein